jgi:serine/threonine-protein kinase
VIDRNDARLGKYRLLAEIAQGGMGDVYLAASLGPGGFNKLVVVKELRSGLAQDRAFLAMFLDEARLSARLSHPNIVQVNEIGEEGGRYFLAMEYLDGPTIHKLLQVLGADRFPRAMWLRVLVDVLAGLHHAHEATDIDGQPLHIVHRDVSPHNVAITYDGQVKVMDFGIAKAMDSTQETRTGVLKGKISYMSPEQARGERVDRRADVFSVGVMLWEACTRERMWRDMPDLAILNELTNGRIPPLGATRASVPPSLAAIVQRALAPDPRDRYATAAQMQTDLEDFLRATGESPAPRDIGRLVAQAFLDQRLRTKTLIDEQLRRLRARAATGEAPSLSVLRLDGTSGSGTLSGSMPGSIRTGASVSRRFPSLATPPSRTVSGTTRTHAPPVGRRAAYASSMMAIGALVTLGVGAAAFALRGSRDPSPPPVAAAPVAVPSPGGVEAPAEARAPARAPAVGTVNVNIRVAPPVAAVYLDGERVGAEGAFVATFPRDGTTHKLAVEAVGYVARAESFVWDHDLEWNVSLEREPSRALAAARPAPPPRRVKAAPPPVAPAAAPPAAAADVAPAPVKRARLPIDPSNPYGQ